jgi:hypothetical protein
MVKSCVFFQVRAECLYIFKVSFGFFPVPVCAITASGVPGGTFVSMNRFSLLGG